MRIRIGVRRGLLLALLCGPSAALAQHEVSASLGSLTYGGFFRSGPGVYAIELGYHRGFGGATPGTSVVRLGGGIRAGIPNSAGPISGTFVAGELFGQLQLRTRIGIWEPLVGPEIGVSGLTAIGWNRSDLPEDVYALEQARISPIYVGFTAAPLRFRWAAYTVSLLELSLGTTVAPLGATSRTRIAYLTLGAVL